jgi:hypothetical protein
MLKSPLKFSWAKKLIFLKAWLPTICCATKISGMGHFDVSEKLQACTMGPSLQVHQQQSDENLIGWLGNKRWRKER